MPKVNTREASKHTKDKQPCLKESMMSLLCVEKQDSSKGNCTMYFDNYRNCVKFWDSVVSDRKKKGIEPHLPLPEDREQVKTEYRHMLSGMKSS